MATLKRLVILLGILIVSSCRGHYPAPKVELCGYANTGELACNNPNLDEPDYFRFPTVGDICSNANDYARTRKYCLDLREKLIKCERNR